MSACSDTLTCASDIPTGEPKGKRDSCGQSEGVAVLEQRLARLEDLLQQLVGQRPCGATLGDARATVTQDTVMPQGLSPQGCPPASPPPSACPGNVAVGTPRGDSGSLEDNNDYALGHVGGSDLETVGVSVVGGYDAMYPPLFGAPTTLDFQQDELCAGDVTAQLNQILAHKNLGEAYGDQPDSSGNQSTRINTALADFQASVASYVPSNSSSGGLPVHNSPLSPNERQLFLQQQEELDRLHQLLAGMTLGDVGAISGSGQSAGSFGSSLVFPAVPRGQMTQQRSAAPRVVAAGPPVRRFGASPIGGTALGEASGDRPTLRPREVKLDRPLTFNGKKKDLANFVFVMRQYIDSVGLGDGSEACRFLVSYLRDDALTWWRSYSRDSLAIFERVDLETLLDELQSHFSDIDRDMKLRDKLFSLRQTSTVQSYVTSFKQLQLELGDARVDDNVALHLVINGLKPFTQQQVLMQRPDTFEDACVLAERADAVVSYANRRQGGGSFRNLGQGHKGVSQYSNSRYKGPAPMVLGAMEQGKPVCFHCGKPGHMKKDCYQLQKQRSGNRGGKQGQYPAAPKN